MKRVVCKECGYRWDVPEETQRANCPKCGRLNLYGFLGKIV